MNKTAKIIVTIVVVLVFFFLYALVVEARHASGAHTPGIFGIIIMAAGYGALKAIWKKEKVKQSSNDDRDSNSILQK